MSQTKIIAIDDDPTGSQTVHGCLLLTRWDVETLCEALADDSPLLFILSNSRALEARQAESITREICRNLRTALEHMAARGQAIAPLIVSRSDSTLRGHYPLETDVIAEELGPFDAHCLVPAFFEGGRITREGTQYLLIEGELVAVHQTEFARDSVFGFSHAYLPDYVEEKTGGRISASAVEHLTLADLHGDLPARLMGLHENVCCVVDAEQPEDLAAFARGVHAALAAGKRLLFRSAASLVAALADLGPAPLAPAQMARLVRGARPGLVLIGSHVERSTRQLRQLLTCPGVAGLEVDLERLSSGEGARLGAELHAAIDQAHRAGQTAVVYTSRGERRFPDAAQRLAFGEQVSALLMELLEHAPPTLGFLIGKGGITSNDILSRGLALRTARVLGQIHPGCSVVRCPEDHPREPNLPVVIFPGNVGDDRALALVYERLSTRSLAAVA